MNWLFILAYMVVQLLIGIWISKRIHSESDYFLGGRNVSLFMVTFSLFATWFGAETCIGSSAAVYRNGLSGSRADPFGYSLCLLLMGLFLAARLRRGRYVTLADLYRERYGTFVEKISIWILIPSSLIWGAAQIRAFGQVISSTTNLPVLIAITVAAVFVLLYTLMGGLLGDIYTDLIQGIFIIIGLAILFFSFFHSVPEWRQILAEMEPARLSLIASQETLLQRIDRWMVPVLGSLVTQEVVSRILASKSVSVARKASFAACGFYFLLASIPVSLGLFGPSLMPGLDDPEQYLIKLAAKFLPGALFVLFSGALISAIVSTIDSILLSISALLSHNLIVPAFKIKKEKMRVFSARLVVLLAGAAAYVIAIYGKGIYELVLLASSFGTAGVLVITVMGLFTKIGGQLSASAALFIGLILMPLSDIVFKLEAPFLASVFGAAIAFVVGALAAKSFTRLSKKGY